MRDLLYINRANDYAEDIGAPVLHPHVCVIHYDEMGEIRYTLNKMGVYAIFVQDNFPQQTTYGISGYDTSKGSLTAASPGQIIGKSDDGHREVYHGWVLLFEADFMHGTAFERQVNDYHFFSYNVNEALHLTDDEKQTIWHLMENIRTVLRNYDEDEKLTDRIVRDQIVLLCDYCLLFYKRQFADKAGQIDLLSRLQHLLTAYYDGKKQHQYGLPSVKYCASELFLSPGYFGDVIRSLTGESPTHYISRYITDRAKSLMVAGKNINQVADELGFEYPQHFSRFFKKQTGLAPSKFIENLQKSQMG